jgi:hypothetical protein
MKKIAFRLVLLFATLCLLQPGLAGASAVPSSNGNGALQTMVLDTVREGAPLVRESAAFEGTRQEALKVAFELLGWGHELELLRRICPKDPLLCLSSAVRPKPPEPFLESPREILSREDLQLLLKWVSECRVSMIWDFSMEGTAADLRLHKEGIAAWPEAWEVRLEDGLEESIAMEKLAELSQAGWPGALRRTPEGLWNLIVGPYPSFLEASRAFSALPRMIGMHMAPPPSLPASPPLFWAALVSENGVLREVRLASEIGKPRASLSELAMAFEAEGGINGGFFSGSIPVGTLVVKGILLHQSYGERSAIGLAGDSLPVFGNGAVDLRAETEKTSFRLDRLNEFPRSGEISLLFEPLPFPNPTGNKPEDVVEIPVSLDLGGSLSIPPVSGRLAVSKAFPERLDLPPGSPIRLRTLWSDPGLERKNLVIQAGPAIVRNGQPNGEAESFNEDPLLERHPRSLVGWDGACLWWIVADGRNPAHSVGLTLEEAAGLALSLGLRDVLNLDGGGSSSLWWKGSLVSSPSGGKERPLPYAILFKAPSGSVFR